MTQINWQYQVNNRAGGYVVTNTDWNDFAGNFRAMIDQTTSSTTDNSALPLGIDLANDRVYISDPDSTTPENANHADTTFSVVGTSTFVGNTQQTGTFTVGVNDSGHDVIFYGATADNSYFWWDESTDAMIIGPASKVGIGDLTPLHTLEVHSDDDVTSFTGTTKGAVKVCNSQYDANDFTCLDFGYSGNNNPLVRIGAKVTGSGTEMHLGTSNDFSAGITNTAIVINNVGAVAVAGALSKGSGTFDIAHPTKSAPWRLRHSFIEGPKADLIYRGTITIPGSGSATVDLDAVSGLTAGTWQALNQDPWSMVTSSGNSVTWALSGKTLTITGPANAICQWMVIGERKDQTVIDWDATDNDGHLIPEYDSSIEDDNDAIGA